MTISINIRFPDDVHADMEKAIEKLAKESPGIISKNSFVVYAVKKYIEEVLEDRSK